MLEPAGGYCETRAAVSSTAKDYHAATMDPFSPFVPAYIRVLVLPVGEIDRTTFVSVLGRLQDEAGIIRLADIVPFLDDDDDFLHAPTTTSKGSLLYDYTTSLPQEYEQQLSPFELFREPLLVIGIVNGSQKQEGDYEEELGDAAQYLKEQHPRVVDRELIVLGGGPDSVGDADSGAENVVFVNRHSEIDDVSLKDALHKISAHFLRHLSTYTMALQMSPSIQTPGQTARSLQRTTSQRDSERRPGSGSGRSTPSQSNDAMSPVEDSGTRQLPWNRGSPATSFDQIPSTSNMASGISRSDSRASTRGKQGPRASSQDRVSVQGFGAGASQDKLKQRGKARVGLVVGSIRMMAGNWSEALRILTEHTNKARILGDHIWHGRGLDNIVTCLLLHSWAGLEYQIPSVCYLIADRAAQRFSVALPSDSKPSDSGQQASVRSLSTALPDLLKLVSSLYRGGEGSLELPPVPIAEATVRFSKTLAVLYLSNGGLDRSILDRFVGRKKVKDYQDLIKPSNASLKQINGLSKMSVAEMLVQVAESDLTGIPDAAHIAILAGVASVYALVGMERKKGMALKDLMARLTVPLQQAHAGARDVDERSRLPSTSTELSSLELSNDSIDGLMNELSRIYGFHMVSGPGSKENPIANRSPSFGFHNLKSTVLDQLWRLTVPTASVNPSRALRLASSALIATGPNGAMARDFVGHPEIMDDKLLDQSEEYAGYVMGGLGIPGSGEEAVYWDRFLVRGFQLLEQQQQLLIHVPENVNAKGPVGGNPLLYDPSSGRSGTAAKPRTRIFAMGEKIECLITFQNVLKVSVAVSSLLLVTEGAELEWLGVPFSIDSNKFTTIHAEFAPRSTGDCAITGCRIKVVGCKEAVFPIFPHAYLPQPVQDVKDIGQDFARAVADNDAGLIDSDGEPEIFRARIVEPLPKLVCDSPHLASPAVTVMAGEVGSLDLVVRNDSNVPAVIIEAQQITSWNGKVRVQSNKSSLNDVGESNSDAGAVLVPPGGTWSLSVGTQFRQHKEQVTLRVFYSRAGSPGKEMRQIELSFDVYVTPGLEMRHFDVLPLEDVADNVGTNFEKCILCFDLTNASTETMNCECLYLDKAQSANAQDERYSHKESLSSNAYSRIRFTIRRLTPQDGAPLTVESLLSILKERLSIRWTADSRHGIVNLASLTLPSGALNSLLSPPVSLTLALLSNDSTTPASLKPTLNAGSFATIRANITNRSLAPKTPLMVSLHHTRLPGGNNNPGLEEKRCAVVGVAKRFVTPFETGKERAVDFVVCCLLSGEVEVWIEVVPVRVRAGRVEGLERDMGVVATMKLAVV